MSTPGPAPQTPTADELIAFLGETVPHICDWIQRAYVALGAPLMHEALAKTLEIEAAGGMYVKDKSRRRTIGGVFLHTLGTKIPAELQKTWQLPKPTPPTPPAPKREVAAQPAGPAAPRPRSVEVEVNGRSKKVVVEHAPRRKR